MSNNNTFHLAITMAGAVSAGAYTAGVMDYLLEVLDKWEDMKTNQKFADKLPKHNIKIEILSGASAGGMTACVSSIMLHQKNKNHLVASNDNRRSELLEPERRKNRLYDSWVNLGHGSTYYTGQKAIFELLGNRDIKEYNESVKNNKDNEEEMVKFPISIFSSTIIRKIAEYATRNDEIDSLDKLASYVADDFDVFVTLTSLKGFKKIVPLQKFTRGTYKADFTTTDHRDVMMFNFGEHYKKEGTINIDFSGGIKNSCEMKLLRDAAISTGAFPIGLEYGIIERNSDYINNNFLMKQIHQRRNGELIVDENQYSSAMIDGGLINNEPFELTELLLKKRLSDKYSEDEMNNRYTMLMIDPFPSESIKTNEDDNDYDQVQHTINQYPYSLFGAIGQLISVARSQLLVKTSFNNIATTNRIKAAIDDNEINSFLISPRKYDKKKNKVVDGDKAIACGTLEGFGGFLDKRFREHDFFLGRINCKSFLQNHFKFNIDELTNENSPFFKSYSDDAKNLFLIKSKDKKTGEVSNWLPIIPDVNMLTEENPKEVVRKEYEKNKYPKFTDDEFEDLFNELKPKISERLKLVLKTKFPNYLTNLAFLVLNFYGSLCGKHFLFDNIKCYVKKNLKDWKIIR